MDDLTVLTQPPAVSAPWPTPGNGQVYTPRGVFAPPQDGGRYFKTDDQGKTAFKVRSLARDIVGLGPLASGIDGRTWSYENGVWRPAPKAIHERAAHLMGQRFRLNHVKDAAEIIRVLQPTITCDPIPEFINFRNGLYEWQTGLLRPHTPEIHSTVQLPTNWNPNATCPEFDKFLASIVAPDDVPLVWELIGYLMYNGNPFHKAVMFHGSGRNGKGTLIRVLNALLGRDNVTSVTLQALANERFGPANLFGKLANLAGDIDGTYLEQTAMFKAITGGDVITAEYKFKDAFDFTPYAVPVFSANKIPGSADTTNGYFSRFLVISFPNNFTGREDRNLDYRLQQPHEIEGIVAKGLIALDHVMSRGNFLETASTKEAMEDFRRKVDQVQTWLEEKDWTIDTEAPIARRDVLYESYKTWADNEGFKKPLRASEFYGRLRALGCTDAKV
ncbi:MAG: phage/plasmid primase, P4 family, partial [Pseudonocardiaceae bacterium]